MTTEEKDIIAEDLKKKCMFLRELLAEIFPDEVLLTIPEGENRVQVEQYREGLKQILNHLNSEYESVLMGKL